MPSKQAPQFILQQGPADFVTQVQAALVHSCHPSYTDKILSQPSVAIRFAKTWSQKYDKFSTSITDQEAIKSCETCEQSCAIELRQRLFRCSHRKKIPNFVSETCGNCSQEYFVSESRGAPTVLPILT